MLPIKWNKIPRHTSYGKEEVFIYAKKSESIQ